MPIAEFHIDVDFNGIVVFAYPDLLPFFSGHIPRGNNILRAFTETDLGDEVVDAGCVIPIINIDDGGYLLRVFLDEAPTGQRQIVFSDPGYVLHVRQQLYAADALAFWEWEENLDWYPLDVPAGYYQVTSEGVQHLDADQRILSVGYDLLLQRSTSLPRRTAVIREDSRVYQIPETVIPGS